MQPNIVFQSEKLTFHFYFICVAKYRVQTYHNLNISLREPSKQKMSQKVEKGKQGGGGINDKNKNVNNLNWRQFWNEGAKF